MRIRILILLAFGTFSVSSQVPPAPASVSISVNTKQPGSIARIWQFFFGSAYSVTNLTCDRSASIADPLVPGDSSTCTVTINQPAGTNGVQVMVTVPAPLIGGPPNGVLTIPAGGTTGTFLVTYPGPTVAPQASAKPFYTSWYNVLLAGAAPMPGYLLCDGTTEHIKCASNGNMP